MVTTRFQFISANIYRGPFPVELHQELLFCDSLTKDRLLLLIIDLPWYYVQKEIEIRPWRKAPDIAVSTVFLMNLSEGEYAESIPVAIKDYEHSRIIDEKEKVLEIVRFDFQGPLVFEYSFKLPEWDPKKVNLSSVDDMKIYYDDTPGEIEFMKHSIPLKKGLKRPIKGRA